MPIQPNGVAPYAPAATILSVIDRARQRGLPTPVTKEVLLRAGVSDSLVPRTLQSLQLLELLNEDGSWTQNLETLRRAPEAELQSRFAEIIRSVYADVFQYIDPATASATEVRDAFRSYAPHGQQDRMVTLFIGLCQRAGIVSGEPPAKTREARPRVNSPAKSIAKPKSTASQQYSAPQFAASSALPSPLAGLLTTLPQGGWTKYDRDRFMNAFAAMLDYCIPMRTEAELREDTKSEAE
jgi:hypothetical protein